MSDNFGTKLQILKTKSVANNQSRAVADLNDQQIDEIITKMSRRVALCK